MNNEKELSAALNLDYLCEHCFIGHTFLTILLTRSFCFIPTATANKLDEEFAPFFSNNLNEGFWANSVTVKNLDKPAALSIGAAGCKVTQSSGEWFRSFRFQKPYLFSMPQRLHFQIRSLGNNTSRKWLTSVRLILILKQIQEVISNKSQQLIW